MPRINLIPLKAARRQVSARNEMFAMMALIGATLAGLVLWYTSVDAELAATQERLASLNKDIDKLTEEVKQVETLQAKEKKVKKKLGVIHDLIGNKTGPARMLDEIATIMTNEAKRVWLTKLAQKEGGELLLEGGAMDHEDISEFQLALERRDGFAKVNLRKVTTKKGKTKSGEDEPAYLQWELSAFWTTPGTG